MSCQLSVVKLKPSRTLQLAPVRDELDECDVAQRPKLARVAPRLRARSERPSASLTQ
jgi:hypothetical protein